MNRFRDPTIDDDRRAMGSNRRERMKVETARIVTALVALDDWAWSEVRAEDYQGLTDSDVARAARKADRLEQLVAACLQGPAA